MSKGSGFSFRLSAWWLAAALPLALGLLLAGCGGAQAAKMDATGGAAAPAATLVTVPLAQMSHVQVVPATTATWPRRLRLTGSVDYDQFVTTPVVSLVGGPVDQILVVPGEQVTQGQPLLRVTSNDFAQDRDTFLKAGDAVALAQKVLRRDEDLYEHHAIPQAQLQQDETAFSQAQADWSSATAALQILGIPHPTPATMSATTPQLPLRSPVRGEVVERDVAPGQLLQAGSTQCFVISNMNTVWVLANVYQSDLAYVQVGDPVTVTSDGYDGSFRGRIQYLSPALDPATRTLQARITTRNPGGVLKKAMFVTATVTAGTLRNIVVVPNAAILRDTENVPFVYVQTGGVNHFAHRSVAIGPSENGFTEVTSGLRAGENVVANGGIFVQFASTFQQ
ncbi:MAG: efflux RND transporter periplasmic adaptor subunit [Terriglobales bacterium]